MPSLKTYRALFDHHDSCIGSIEVVRLISARLDYARAVKFKKALNISESLKNIKAYPRFFFNWIICMVL